jgi:predicted enzyme related to lactoylglutathione lyase
VLTRGGAIRQVATADTEIVMPGKQVMHVQAQPLIAVSDVRASTRWYKELLGLSHSVSVHDALYQRMMDGDRLVLQLHAWDEENHPNLTDRGKAKPGHGVLVWFEVADVDSVVRQARKLGAKILHGPELNENSGAMEIWVEDLDGYVVVAASADGA